MMTGRSTRVAFFVVSLLVALLMGALHPILAADPPKDPAALETEIRAQLEKTPGDPELLFRLGNALYDQGRRQEAQTNFEKALVLKPDFVKAMVNLGVVLNESGKSEEALKYFESALAVSPKDVTVLCNKGQALYALRKYPQAIDLYRQGIRIDANAQLPHYLLGVAFADAGIYREAIVEWEKVVQIDPKTEAATTANEGIKVLRTLLPQGEQAK
jgi:tetratricopeptide (TPR) repeat protein